MSAELSPLFDWRTAVADSELSSNAKLLAMMVSLYMSKQGSAFPSQETLAKNMSSSVATVRRATRELVKERWLEVEVGGGRRANRYTAKIPKTAQSDPVHTAPPPNEYPTVVSGMSDELAIELDINPLDPSLRSGSPAPNGVSTVFAHWQTARGKSNRHTLTPARKAKIQARLREFTAADLCRAIDAVASDPWPERSLHDDLTQLFRSQDAVERWLELADRGPPRYTGKNIGADEALRQALASYSVTP